MYASRTSLLKGFFVSLWNKYRKYVVPTTRAAEVPITAPVRPYKYVSRKLRVRFTATPSRAEMTPGFKIPCPIRIR